MTWYVHFTSILLILEPILIIVLGNDPNNSALIETVDASPLSNQSVLPLNKTSSNLGAALHVYAHFFIFQNILVLH